MKHINIQIQKSKTIIITLYLISLHTILVAVYPRTWMEDEGEIAEGLLL